MASRILETPVANILKVRTTYPLDYKVQSKLSMLTGALDNPVTEGIYTSPLFLSLVIATDTVVKCMISGVKQACSEFLEKQLDPSNCLGIRIFAGQCHKFLFRFQRKTTIEQWIELRFIILIII